MSWVLHVKLPVNGEIHPHELGEGGVVEAEHLGEVPAPVLVGVDGADTRAVAVQVTVNDGGQRGQLGHEVHGVLVHVLKHTPIHDILVHVLKHTPQYTPLHGVLMKHVYHISGIREFGQEQEFIKTRSKLAGLGIQLRFDLSDEWWSSMRV
jgi:hypothetical protein